VRVGLMGADTTAIKKDERSTMNKHTGLEKETSGKMFVGTYRCFAHPMSMITTVGQHLLGIGDRR